MRTGQEYLQAIQDQRTIYLNGQRVDNVTTHPAFIGITQTFASMYDFAAEEENGMQYLTEDGTVANKVYMMPRNRDELRERREAIEKWAKQTCGFVGRSPDHVAAFLAAFASHEEIFARGGERFAKNVQDFYKKARDEDLFLSYVIIPPQIDRSKSAHEQKEDHLPVGVYEERPEGIIVRGSQMLGTSAAVSDYLFVSCIVPLREGDEDYAISFVVPINTPGLKLYSRPSFAMGKPSTFDYPLSTQFDESDCLVVFDDVLIPWEQIFVYRNIELVRAQFHESPAHIWGNSQAQVRFVTKLKFLIGVAKKITEMNGTDRFPQVQEKLADMASLAATVEGSLLASEYHCLDRNGYAVPNPRFLYGVVGMQESMYSRLISILRDLSGGGVLQVPSSYLEMVNPETREDIKRYIRSSQGESTEKIQLFKLAWDIIGSEFAGRHQQYELFYNGAPHVAKGYSFRNYNFQETTKLVDQFLGSYRLPE
ncbi:4-hydroxyphenylacetate 3-monooxygenase [Seinonella peptonophila]|uniref:4-hydroxyphenylacetate 3-monooxygenase n=1 Tax=Seinonella peptonophila TaxID=112248 RepID=A0A1M4VJV8_9BACL|nr:4-hydroxyphenylacetate 3-hydroxylase N-terminal domain-containing protein [Seinonella peptonophila]SHE69147.1 4-hydroxyphenylacetate 3-monooxygenase [Seinonella peptonophila]